MPLTDPVAEAVAGIVTPFAMVAAAVSVLHALGAARTPVLLAIAAGTLYVQGRGAHLAADSIQRTIDADIVTFWDERFGHIASVLGWVGIIAAFCLAERAARPPWTPSAGVLLVSGALLGSGAFAATVEGQTWWLQIVATALFAAWAIREPRPLLRTIAGAFSLATLLIAGWAVWHGGMPELSAV